MAAGRKARASAEASAGGKRKRKIHARWSDALAERLLARLAAGEFLYRITREPGMPTPEGVAKWARERPEFAERLDAARRAGGRPPGQRGPVSTFSEHIAEEVIERLCEGESLTGIGADPTMPCLSTLMRWRRERADFENAVQVGMRARAERLCDTSWEMAEAATPETAYLTGMKLAHLRWMAGVMAPRVFRPRLVEPEAPRDVRTVMFRHFKIEKDPETGKDKVVGYCPNPHTGEVEREDTPGYRRPTGPGRWFVLPA